MIPADGNADMPEKRRSSRTGLIPRLSALIAMVILPAVFSGCAVAPPEKEEPAATAPEELEIAILREVVRVDRENIREYPNGPVIGEAERGDTLEILDRRLNWMEIEYEGASGFIWAPSLGREKLPAISLPLLLGRGDSFSDPAKVWELYGEPVSEKHLGGGLQWLEYSDAGALFGVREFTAIRFLADNQGGAVLKVEVDLPPFVGSAGDLLSAIGLKPASSTQSGFEKVTYSRVFDCAAEVTLTRHQGDFTRFAGVAAEKLDGDRWRDDLRIEEKRAEKQDGVLKVILLLENASGSRGYAAPSVRVEMIEGARQVGTWTLGPGAMRIGPGENRELELPVPIDPSTLELADVGLSAELVDMITVPTAKD